MPKPRSGVDGSGMHINMFLLDQDGRNVFYDREDPDHLSAEGRHFMAGILNHISGLTALTNPLVNSYKRLVPGFEAPVYATWSAKTSFATSAARLKPIICWYFISVCSTVGQRSLMNMTSLVSRYMFFRT